MDINVEHISKVLIDLFNNKSIRHEMHSFNSGVVMIDAWVNHNFYVIQIEKGLIGISNINDDNPGFDNKPDKLFYNPDEFLEKLQSLLMA